MSVFFCLFECVFFFSLQFLLKKIINSNYKGRKILLITIFFFFLDEMFVSKETEKGRHA